MLFDFYDYMALAMALVMCLAILLAVHLYDKDAPRYIRVPIMLLIPVFFILSIYCCNNRPENVRRHAAYEQKESRVFFINDHKVTSCKENQVDDGMFKAEIPEHGHFQIYLHSVECPCFKHRRDTVTIAGHKYIREPNVYIHVQGCK